MSNNESHASSTASINDNNSGNFIVRSAATTTSTTTQVIRKKYEKLKTLILKLKPNSHQQDLSSLNPDQLDAFVDEMISDLENTLLSNTNDLRERIKQARPHPDDPQYNEKIILYKELLEQFVPVMQKLQSIISQILDELHTLVTQLWDDISKNNGKLVERLLEEHQTRTEAHMNEKWIKNIQLLEDKLNIISKTN